MFLDAEDKESLLELLAKTALKALDVQIDMAQELRDIGGQKSGSGKAVVDLRRLRSELKERMGGDDA